MSPLARRLLQLFVISLVPLFLLFGAARLLTTDGFLTFEYGKPSFPPRPICHQCFVQAAQNTVWKFPVLQISSRILNNVFWKEL